MKLFDSFGNFVGDVDVPDDPFFGIIFGIIILAIIIAIAVPCYIVWGIYKLIVYIVKLSKEQQEETRKQNNALYNTITTANVKKDFTVQVPQVQKKGPKAVVEEVRENKQVTINPASKPMIKKKESYPVRESLRYMIERKEREWESRRESPEEKKRKKFLNSLFVSLFLIELSIYFIILKSGNQLSLSPWFFLGIPPLCIVLYFVEIVAFDLL